MNIRKFRGKYGFLSNFHSAEFIDENGRVWPTVEHYYQAHKTLNYESQEDIRLTHDLREVKLKGRYVDWRSDWDDVKQRTMLFALRQKFSQNSELGARLLETEDSHLTEGNDWHDNEWGDCECSACKRVEGQNLLGKLLMQVREELKEEG